MEILQAYGLFAANRGFQKKKEQLIAYKSGGNTTQVDYFLVKKKKT